MKQKTFNNVAEFVTVVNAYNLLRKSFSEGTHDQFLMVAMSALKEYISNHDCFDFLGNNNQEKTQEESPNEECTEDKKGCSCGNHPSQEIHDEDKAIVNKIFEIIKEYKNPNEVIGAILEYAEHINTK